MDKENVYIWTEIFMMVSNFQKSYLKNLIIQGSWEND